ncbi:MAG: hypothetical protein GY928_22515 [Colwellia sp.]|nr:hypothetical protein [Colwellia sp.]
MMEKLEINSVHHVSGHHWIECFIGYADNAFHGHGLRDISNNDTAGSFADGDKLKILEINGYIATVVLLCNKTPYGARAPHGTVFNISTEIILDWPNQLKQKIKEKNNNSDRMKKFKNALDDVPNIGWSTTQ